VPFQDDALTAYKDRRQQATEQQKNPSTCLKNLTSAESVVAVVKIHRVLSTCREIFDRFSPPVTRWLFTSTIRRSTTPLTATRAQGSYSISVCCTVRPVWLNQTDSKPRRHPLVLGEANFMAYFDIDARQPKVHPTLHPSEPVKSE
jgi:hypothetical protein